MKLTIKQLKHIVHCAIQESKREEEGLLVEPDFSSDEEEQEEVSAGGVAGFALPLGASPPGYNRKRFIRSAKASFGGADE